MNSNDFDIIKGVGLGILIVVGILFYIGSKISKGFK